MMKRTIILIFLSLVLSFGTAYALNCPSDPACWTGSVYNDTLDAYVPGIQNFDWNEAGSGLAQGIAPGTAPIGATFNFMYQANLVSVSDPSGGAVAFPGMNIDFEYTVVATIPEKITSVTPIAGGGFLAIFTTQPGGTFSIWHDGPGNLNAPAPPRAPNSDTPSGVGFDDGDFVASGTMTAGQTSIFTALPGGIGLGSTLLEGFVTSASGLYLLDNLVIFDFSFTSNLNQPPGNSVTAAFFAGVEAGAYPTYIVNPAGDTYFKVDGKSTFSQKIPEPSSILLLGAGLLGLAGFARKRIQK